MAVSRKPAAKPAAKADSKSEPELGPACDVDVVSVVSRLADGSPAYRDGFVLCLPEDATDVEVAAAWNNDGELPPKNQPIIYVPRG